MNTECKNYTHKYKCDTYNENSDACKNCEMRAVESVVFTIRHSEVLDDYFISSNSRGISSNPIQGRELFTVMKEFKELGEREGFKAVFEVD